MTYLITGATGDVGSKVVHQLIQRGERPRIFVRNAEKAQAQFGNQVDIRVGDLADAASLQRASEGVEKLFLVNSGPQIPVLDDLAAQAAKSAGIRHIVKLSSFDVEQKLAIGAWHEKGEAAIRASGIAFSFVRPTGFMSNLLAWSRSIVAEGIVRSSTGDGRRPFIRSEDIAAVAVCALTTNDFVGKVVSITGPQALSFVEITEKIGGAIGRQLKYQPISDEEAGRRFSATGASPEEIAAHVELWRAIREGRFGATTNEVERILGRKPVALDQWLVENAAAFRG
jgi:(4-alkanoyl-5-oxo-2,5-dihydrofuran-3-yl)methyl phosphate reductase